MSKVFVAGHRGMVGSAIVRRLAADDSVELVTQPKSSLDLLDQAAVASYFEREKFDRVVLAAAKVGGIVANNTYPADFIYQNLLIQNNVIGSAFQSGVERLLFLGSSCIYPRNAKQPMREAALLTGELEKTNEPYAIAKIAGIKLCESFNRQYGTDYRSVMPTNLYGEGDNFHPENSHVIPAMMRRFHLAKERGDDSVEVWGTGTPRREFLHVDDMASACVHVLNLDRQRYQAATEGVSHVNIGVGEDCSIAELAQTMAEVVGFDGSIEFDTSKPDGTPRKLLDVSVLESLGWSARISLRQGLEMTYQWFLEHSNALRGVA